MKQRFSFLSVSAIAILLAMSVLFLHTAAYAEDANVNTPNLIAPSPDSNNNAVANVNEDLNVNADENANVVLDDTNVNAQDAVTATTTNADDQGTTPANTTLIVAIIVVAVLILIVLFSMRRKKPQQPQ